MRVANTIEKYRVGNNGMENQRNGIKGTFSAWAQRIAIAITLVRSVNVEIDPSAREVESRRLFPDHVPSGLDVNVFAVLIRRRDSISASWLSYLARYRGKRRRKTWKMPLHTPTRTHIYHAISRIAWNFHEAEYFSTVHVGVLISVTFLTYVCAPAISVVTSFKEFTLRPIYKQQMDIVTLFRRKFRLSFKFNRHSNRR